MGGHGHHHEPYKVPDASIYKVEDVPELLQVQKSLARQGLRDPWLRNEVWRYNVKEFGTHRQRLIKLLFRGFGIGLVACCATLGIEYAFNIDYTGGRHHGHGHGHDKESHGEGGHH